MSTTSVSPAFDESALVVRAKAGDQDAFNELVLHYDRRVFRMAKQITENDDDAEDVLQETFLKAYTHLDDFQGNSKFYTWLVRIAVNEALMKLRKRRSDKTVPLDEPIDTGEDEVVREIAVWDQNPEDLYSREELATLLDQAVQSLKAAYRTVFILRDIEDLSIEETAETLGLSISAVKSRLLRARLQLREKLTRQFKKRETTRLLTCKQFLQELSGYLDKTLDPQELAELHRHVSECPNCFVVCDTTEKTLRVFKGMECQPVPKGIQARLMAAIEKRLKDRGGCGCSGESTHH